MGPLISLFWTFGYIPCGFQSQTALFVLGRGVHVTHSMRFTSGVTAEPFPSTYLQGGIGEAQIQHLLCRHCLTVWDHAYPSYAGSVRTLSHCRELHETSRVISIKFHITNVYTWLSKFCRFFAICYPMKVRSICTTRRAKIVILVLWIISAAYGLPIIFTQVCFLVTLEKSEKGQFRCQQWNYLRQM